MPEFPPQLCKLPKLKGLDIEVNVFHTMNICDYSIDWQNLEYVNLFATSLYEFPWDLLKLPKLDLCMATGTSVQIQTVLNDTNTSNIYYMPGYSDEYFLGLNTKIQLFLQV